MQLSTELKRLLLLFPDSSLKSTGEIKTVVKSIINERRADGPADGKINVN